MKERAEFLRGLISAREKVCEKEKWLRVKRTFLVLSGFIYFLAFAWGEINSWIEYLGWLLAAPFYAGLIMFGSLMVLLYIWSGVKEEERYIARLKGELDAIIRFNEKKDEL